ncbi:unnamed protein product [Durusdinium trenchii]
MSKMMWNSDSMHVKKQIERDKHLPKSGSDSSGTHESFPVHGLADTDGCKRKASAVLGGYEVEDGGSLGGYEVEDGGSEEHSPLGRFTGSFRGEVDKIHQTKSDLASKPLKGGKLVLRPYGLDEKASAKAELLQRALEGHFELEGPGRKVVVGDQVVELDFLCAKMEESEVDYVKTLHRDRERTIDVSVVKTSRFGEVVRKTYLTQTMHRFRRHSCLQDQLLYEAAIIKSLSKVEGVVPVLAWSKCSPKWFPGCDTYQLRSLYFPYIDGNHSPKEPQDIHLYMKQLLQVLDALHLREIVHCNIKRENVLYADGKLTLIDFESAVNEHELVDMGNSEYGNDLEVCYRSNPYHSAPEVLIPQTGRSKHGHNVLYGHRRDVYGAGIILAELLLGMDEHTRLFYHSHSEYGRRSHSEYGRRSRDRVNLLFRVNLRKQFHENLRGRRGNMQEALDGLRMYGKLKGTMFYK